jgi:hypothetical protein
MVARQKLQKQALQDQCYVWRTLKKKTKSKTQYNPLMRQTDRRGQSPSHLASQGMEALRHILNHVKCEKI